MIEDRDQLAPQLPAPANDNAGPGARVAAVVVTLARLLGRQMTREDFARRAAANDNRPPAADDD